MLRWLKIATHAIFGFPMMDYIPGAYLLILKNHFRRAHDNFLIWKFLFVNFDLSNMSIFFRELDTET